MNEAVDAARAMARDPDVFLPDQFSNPANPEAHRTGTGPEILRALDNRVDVFVAGIGTGGTITGVGEALKANDPATRIVAVEPASSAVLSGGPPGPHRIQGIGAGFVPAVLNRDIVDEVMSCTDEQAIGCAHLLAAREGILAGISCGAAVWAALEVARAARVARPADRRDPARLRRALHLRAVLRAERELSDGDRVRPLWQTIRHLRGRRGRDALRRRGRPRARPGRPRGRAFEILLTWPGVHALLAYRVAHVLHAARVPLAAAPDRRSPRGRSRASRSIPPRRSARALFIDHGTGVVIGETAEIGDNVTLYQGVTLGGTGFATGKRHPTVQDNVTIGSGAKLLGPITVGHGAKIGANSVVITDVPPNSTVVGNPGHPVRVDGRRAEGPDADWIHLPDPIADAIRALSRRIEELEATLAEREGDGADNGESRTPNEVRRIEPRRGPNPAGG